MRIYQVLLIDQESITNRVVDLALSSQGISFQLSMSSSAEADMGLKDQEFDLIIADHPPGEIGAPAILKITRELNLLTPVIIYSANYDPSLVIESFRAGAADYLLKPCSVNELADRLNNCLCKAVPGGNPSARHKNVLLDKQDQVSDLQLTMAHDIRSPIISMLSYLKLLNSGRFGGMDQGVASKLGDLARRCHKLLGITDEYLADIFRMNDGVSPRQTSLNLIDDIIDPVLDELAEDIAENHITLDNISAMPYAIEDLYVTASAVELKAVFRNLLTNAIKHGGKGCTIGFNIQKWQACYRISIFNSGPEISEIDRYRLFTITPGQFRQTPTGNGAGVGLYLTKRIITRHGGDLWYESVGANPHFVFTLPYSAEAVLQ